jgi:hypothetical protein
VSPAEAVEPDFFFLELLALVLEDLLLLLDDLLLLDVFFFDSSFPFDGDFALDLSPLVFTAAGLDASFAEATKAFFAGGAEILVLGAVLGLSLSSFRFISIAKGTSSSSFAGAGADDFDAEIDGEGPGASETDVFFLIRDAGAVRTIPAEAGAPALVRTICAMGLSSSSELSALGMIATMNRLLGKIKLRLMQNAYA